MVQNVKVPSKSIEIYAKIGSECKKRWTYEGDNQQSKKSRKIELTSSIHMRKRRGTRIWLLLLLITTTTTCSSTTTATTTTTTNYY